MLKRLLESFPRGPCKKKELPVLVQNTTDDLGTSIYKEKSPYADTSFPFQ